MERPDAASIVLCVALLLPPLALVLRHRFFPGMRSTWLFLLSGLAVYLLLLAGVQLLEGRLANELLAFDLDGDGSFSPAEMTPAAEAAMTRVISDAGRRFAPFTGIVYALLYVAMVFGLAKMFGASRRVEQSRGS